jgi:hypothetical protein
MPDGTITTEYSDPIPLKSLPPDGYITVRPMPYGRMVKRRDSASRMSMEAATKARGRKASEEEVQKISIETLQYNATVEEWAYCIGDHNITDKHGRKLDFSNPISIDVLSPKVGAEIESILTELNGGDEDLEDFTQPASESSGNSNLPTSAVTGS